VDDELLDDELLDGRFPQVAWRTTAPDWDFMRRWSLQHRYDLEHAPTTAALCGARIRWPYVGPGESGDDRRCKRCDAAARRRVERASVRRA
jgi:hypothetical protein